MMPETPAPDTTETADTLGPLAAAGATARAARGSIVDSVAEIGAQAYRDGAERRVPDWIYPTMDYAWLKGYDAAAL